MQSEIKKLPFDQVAHFPKLFLDYVHAQEELLPLYGQFPTLEGFGVQLQQKRFSTRETLVDALRRQYGSHTCPAIDLLQDERTFTVTTGHQLNIFTGPLYVIYKIVSTINLARKLKEAYPEYHFVPVYWMATEDHDLEEISSFNLFGQKLIWETEQRGAVGEMDPQSIRNVFDQLKERPEIFWEAYTQNATLADAVRQYMHALFGEEGLVCIDGNDPELKRLFVPVIIDELENRTVKKKLDENALQLEKLGYKTQINAREINLFYKEKGLRERIDYQEPFFHVLETDLRFTKEELLQLVESAPEKFSPNVALRPLYQEMILPNLAYLGGPSELAYWLQLKGLFDHYGVEFPILLPRNLALAVPPAVKKRLDKLGVEVEELFLDDVVLKKRFVERNSERSLTLEEELNQVSETFALIRQKAIAVDPTLEATIEAEKTKVLKSVSNLEGRLKKMEEKKFETAIAQLLSTKEKLFPGGGQQERRDNFLNFYLNDPGFINKLFSSFDPLDLRFNILFT